MLTRPKLTMFGIRKPPAGQLAHLPLRLPSSTRSSELLIHKHSASKTKVRCSARAARPSERLIQSIPRPLPSLLRGAEEPLDADGVPEVVLRRELLGLETLPVTGSLDLRACARQRQQRPCVAPRATRENYCHRIGS